MAHRHWQLLSFRLLKPFKPETPRVRRLVLFSAIVMLFFCVIVLVQAINSYNLAEKQGKDDATRLTRILSDHVELTLLSVDLSLRRAVERQYFNALFGGNLPEYMDHNFARWVEDLPQISAMMLINEQGQVEAAAYEKGFENFVISSKSVEGSYMLEEGRRRGMQDSFFYLTPGFRKDETGKDTPNNQVIVMSRKLSKLDGTYGGVVMAAIDPQYFIDFFDSISHGEDHFMSVYLSDGSVMVSGPKKGAPYDALSAFMKRDKQETVRNSDMIHTHVQDFSDSKRIVSYNLLGSFPIFVAIALDSRDYMEAWRSNQYKDLLFLTIFLLFGSALSLFAITMEKQIKRVQLSESSAVLASQTKSEFLANMSHEFRTPLNAIIGFSEMLLSNYFGSLTAKQKERIHDINLCGNHLLQLISDILEFSKGEAGKLDLKEEKVDIPQTVEECKRIMREKIQLKQVSLGIQLDELHPYVWADQRKIRQILLNLLSNAVKFTPQNGSITVSSHVDEQNRFHLTVQDTGIGIAEQDIQKALSVFGQVHRSQSLEGTGLGLPLCKIFADLHGGELHLSSHLGVGTTVDIIFPPERTRNDPMTPEIATAEVA